MGGVAVNDGRTHEPALEVRVLAPGDEAVLSNCADGVFDDQIDWERSREFLSDCRHHLAVAISDGTVVGMASAVSYLHPDKPHPELWINEVGVAPGFRRRGIGRQLVQAMLSRGRAAGCREAWVLTEHGNAAALALYRGVGGLPQEQVLVSFDLDTA